jgi:hypothetical protein
MESISWLVLLSTFVDVTVAVCFLFFRTGKTTNRPVTLWRVSAAAIAAASSFVIKLPLWQLAGLDLFGVMHLVYVELVVVVPLCGLSVVLAQQRLRVTKPAIVLAWATLGIIPLGVYASFIEPFRLQVEQVSIQLPPEREGRRPVRIGVLSDIQTDRVTDYERSAVGRMMMLKPDVILLPGDLFQGTQECFERELPALRDLLSKLSAPAGVYCVMGNIDTESRIEQATVGTDVKLLINEIAHIRLGDRQLTLGGVELAYTSKTAQDMIDRLQNTSGPEDICILLAHLPDAVFALPSPSRIDLVVCGHTHGGQIQLPLWGPLLTFSHVPRWVAAGGLHDLDGRRIYVSRGVGYERGQAPRIRFLCPPEVSLLTLSEPN